LSFSVRSAFQLVFGFNLSLRDLYNKMPGKFAALRDFCEDSDLEERLRTDSRYEIYQGRLTKQVLGAILPLNSLSFQMESVRNEMNSLLPENLDYTQMDSLSLECREKLDRLRPANLAAASRIEGITPEALISLLRYVEHR
jgi:tRNA uridine 5-carboxymethylaminomethyl modification enzyme